ncbi:acyl-coa n-acyltransferase [Trichococcus palustris]|jgi:uncharacterized protein|uniref:Acyl-coa n-acyltransferase n=1 Tax=Trichococcus palustris TaxID=140314 RepID=A0A143YI28_9LACT|nr:GNAT family N-acetyltransferase [Trichococcus palustris]CZQ89866.1 acyl-coa n-acyltransferase [Trichococcus palustris]SFK98656.1 hypothetical protein SAMN04488076_11231 [Trichococcus palustris]
MDFEKERSRFYKKDENGVLIAEIDYTLDDEGYICITSTFVDDDYRGQGIAGQLVDAVVEMAREENRKIDPLCPYAKSVFKKNPERYSDVKK